MAAGGSRTLLKSGDRVCYYLTRAQETAFDTVYEDENLLVTDKADGVNAEAVYETLARERGAQGVYFIHRLDRNTRGLMIFAKNEACAEELKRAFKERDVEKTYLAADGVSCQRRGAGGSARERETVCGRGKDSNGISADSEKGGYCRVRSVSAYGKNSSDPRACGFFGTSRAGRYEIRR